MSHDTVDASDIEGDALVGEAVTRREDYPLLTGEAEYTDDITRPGECVLAIARSRFAHARIEAVDVSGATDHGDVIAAYTADDLEADDIPGTLPTDDPDFGTAPEHPILATDRVRYQGQPIAAVVAEDKYAAHDAIDAIDIEYERLTAAPDIEAATDEEAPTIHETAPDNVAFQWDEGDEPSTEAAFAQAADVVSLDLVNNRVIPTPMETRAALASYRPSTGKVTLEMSTQNPHSVQSHLATALGLSEGEVRVRPPDVGGGFGAKLQPYAGHVLAVWAAMQVERPVKWKATRTEEFQASVHARSHETTAELALDGEGYIEGLRVRTQAEVGGYMTTGGAGVPTYSYGRMLTGQYDIPAAHVTVTGVFTTTTPLSAYRGAGRPEAAYVIERLVNAAAAARDEDPATFRRRNFLTPKQFPYEAPLDHTYDSGDYERALEAALEAADYEALRERQARLQEKGRYLGIGLSCYVESCGGSSSGYESGLVRVKPSGEVTAFTGTADTGQGHETSFAQIVAETLGVAYDDVDIVEGDTDRVPEGGGTAGSRSAPMGGNALRKSAERIVEKARRIAAYELEADPADLEHEDGAFRVAGAPSRAVTMEEVADAAYGSDLPPDIERGLETTTFFTPDGSTFPFGCHVAVVEVDPETGAVSFDRYVTVDDVGPQINPKLVEGQIHGGIAQGLGQALLERAEYDDNGNLVSGSLQDYAMPRAADIPEMETNSTVTPSPNNPMGVKGVGEAGTIGAPPAVVNAVADALALAGVEREAIQMPLDQESLWRAITQAEDSG
ncbi:MAG: xanthine dehydrogenase family protein molybdopterin-binding subunit [Halodesulfurarchaeum sp.]